MRGGDSVGGRLVGAAGPAAPDFAAEAAPTNAESSQLVGGASAPMAAGPFAGLAGAMNR